MKIKSITEAYSLQPFHHEIVPDPLRHSFPSPGDCLMDIKCEKINIDGDSISYYCGYSWNGNLLFQYRANSVNIQYVQP